MTIVLESSEFEQLWAQENDLAQTRSSLETLLQVPESLGQGYVRETQLDAEFSVEIWDIQGKEDLLVQCQPHQHPVEFGVLLSGVISSDINGGWNSDRTLISGGGIQRKMRVEYLQAQPIIGINIQLSPNRLAMLFPSEDGQITPELEFLTKGDDWQSLLYPRNTAEITSVVQQIRCCPYQGITKRLYLQAKALEIMSLQLAPLFDRAEETQISPQLKSQTIAKLHYAREIIRSRLDNPPTHLELSQQLEISDRTLRRGFRSLFSTTIFGYITEQRLQQAELLLRDTDRSVADIANHVGYTHLGYFARAFKRQYGLNPSDIRSDRKSGWG